MKKVNRLHNTDDASHTLFNIELGEYYHSTYGAIQESEHVFIQSGLDLFVKHNSTINIFEVGFGTGLNALLCLDWAEKNKIKIQYQAVELYPITVEQAKELNYPGLLNISDNIFLKMHKIPEKRLILSEHFSLQKHLVALLDLELMSNHFDLIFFDAFSPDVQPEMWTVEVFSKIAFSMKRGGVLTTYSCKGIVKRALKSAGFEIEKLPGPKGKREILRGIKA